jgi:hypothetical protein
MAPSVVSVVVGVGGGGPVACFFAERPPELLPMLR